MPKEQSMTRISIRIPKEQKFWIDTHREMNISEVVRRCIQTLMDTYVRPQMLVDPIYDEEDTVDEITRNWD